MRVKRLDIFGFKSFAKKTTIHFEPGVTAIVGPNGSGKSNIVDSIRWVLGEHNPRDVRAPRLEDVIFNGTDLVAPLSMAEVQLTIANEQGLLPIAFSEVAITRRVFRSGETEFQINGSPCRLRDINELFLGTGLGGGTYAIIAQGHIDMILSSKPEERRVVFEEASGVAKYLAKKAETTRRLDETEEHLVRIADITSEVRRQVNALERQANKARQYRTQWDQLKSYELRLAVDELSTGETRARALEEALQGLTASREAFETEKQGHVTSIESCNAAVSRIQHELQGLRTNVVECVSHIEQHGSQQQLKSRWIDELKQQAQQLEVEVAQLEARIAQVDEQLARVGGGSTEIETQLAASESQCQQIGHELEALESTVGAAVAAVQVAKSELFGAASEAAHRRNQLTEMASQLQGFDAQLARLEEQCAQRQAQRDDVANRLTQAGLEARALREQYETVNQAVDVAQHALDGASARRHELSGRLRQVREQLALGRAQATMLEDLWKHYEGFSDSVKELMGRHLDGVIGPLADLIEALPGYEEVVESALGPLGEALVVRDRQALARCRETLSAVQLEGCRFLVLSDCPAIPMAMDPALVQDGVQGTVKQYVRTQAPYQPLVDWLLNDSWVIDDIQRLMGQHVVPQRRLVSARGDRWDRRSWRFAGAKTAAQGRVGRKQRWEQAVAGMMALEVEAARLEQDASLAEQEWQRQIGSQESSKGQLAQLTPSLQKADAQLAHLSHEARRLEEDGQVRDAEAKELIARREEIRTSLGAMQHASHEADARQQALERSLAEAHAAREQADQAKQQLLVSKAQVDTGLASLRDRLQALQSRRQEIETDRQHVTQQVEAKRTQRQDALRRIEELSLQLTEHAQEAQRLTAERTQVELEAERVGQTLREEETKRDQILPHLLSVEQKMSELGRRIEEQSRQLSERGFRRTRLLERLWELYQIDEPTIQAELKTDVSPLTDEQRATMTAEVQKLRSKLEGLGPVSLGSVEEYDQLKQRLEFLQTQQQDLTQARDDLKASIQQINRTAKTQFRETFDRITQEFKHYYTRLFNGGEANLILVDEENVLESGIEIVARPPGKRLQSISLLSGGERALTAIALLFALFKVRPSPFCILDEIDAPLDEANVDRFTRVLEEFLALSQFILITHNKKTITKADSIYGVTMEEAGISKILSARLTSSASTPAPAIDGGKPGPAPAADNSKPAPAPAMAASEPGPAASA